MLNVENAKTSSFLNFEENKKGDYQLIRAGKSLYNINKHQLYKINHCTIKDFFVLPKNNYNTNPFNGQSGFYIDFDISKMDYTIYQFVLQFTILNTSANSGQCMPLPLMIDKVSLLKDGSTFGNDVYDFDIYLSNLYKYANEYKDNNIVDLGLMYSANGNKLISLNYASNGSFSINLELPVSLARSEIPLNSISKDLVLRVYFKSNIVYSGINNSDIQLSNVQLVLRVNDMCKNKYKSITQQPKLNHLFNKRLFTKVPLNGVVAGQSYSLTFPGVNCLAGAAFVFLRKSPNNIDYASLGNLYHHLLNVSIDQVFITNGAGQNIFDSNLKIDKDYNKYLMYNHFKKFYENIRALTDNDMSGGLSQIYYIPLAADGSDTFNGCYSSGISFTEAGDYKICFQSNTTYSGNLELNIMFFSGSCLTVENGDIIEV